MNLKGVSGQGTKSVRREIDDAKIGESCKLTKLQALHLSEARFGIGISRRESVYDEAPPGWS